MVPSWADQLLLQLLCLYNVDTLNICVKEFGSEKIIFDKMTDQLLLQLLMEQFDTLPIQCRHIEHMNEGVWFTKMTAVRT